MSLLIHADSPQVFETEVLQSTQPVVVDVWAAWCGQRRTVAPELEALAADRCDGARPRASIEQVGDSA